MRVPTKHEVITYMNICKNTGVADSRLLNKAAKFFHVSKDAIKLIIK